VKAQIVLFAAVAILLAYAIAYRVSAHRDATRFRNADVFVHIRYFPHDWECRLFYPAAYVEGLIIQAYPYPFLPHPSWWELRQVLLLEGPEYRATFPRDGLRRA
jgi:hypothetical protein